MTSALSPIVSGSSFSPTRKSETLDSDSEDFYQSTPKKPKTHQISADKIAKLHQQIFTLEGKLYEKEKELKELKETCAFPLTEATGRQIVNLITEVRLTHQPKSGLDNLHVEGKSEEKENSSKESPTDEKILEFISPSDHKEAMTKKTSKNISTL